MLGHQTRGAEALIRGVPEPLLPWTLPAQPSSAGWFVAFPALGANRPGTLQAGSTESVSPLL